MPLITVPKVLREKLGAEGADSLIELINKADGDAKEDVLVFVEEKFERRLTEEISKVNEQISKEIAGVNEHISKEDAGLNASFTKLISEVKADMIKWMFIFWVGQIGVILGILSVFFMR